MTELSRADRIRLLRSVALFEGVPDAGLAAIADAASIVRFEADRTIARQGEVGTGFFLVVTGRVRVVRDGRLRATIEPGGFFGELSLLDRGPRVAAVVADEPSDLLALASWDLETILAEQPGVALAILRGVAARLRAVTEDASH
ncbi:MAG: cyclic nucleotide-binding domain-containing protein [Candidatus Limnocylindrales bacterium]